MVPTLLRSRHTAIVFAALLVAALGLWSPAPAHADGGMIRLLFGDSERVIASGRLQTERRAVTGFNAIVLRSGMKLVLHQGQREGVDLRADDNLLPLIETRVIDRGGIATLEIGVKREFSMQSRNPIVATVDLTTLSGLTISGAAEVETEALKSERLKLVISGSGNVRMVGLEVGELTTRVSGSGDIRLGGRAARLAVSISGSGQVDSRNLEADDVSVDIAGSGNADVAARKTLVVSISGSGNVVYSGDAAVRSSMAGHGSVRRR